MFLTMGRRCLSHCSGLLYLKGRPQGGHAFSDCRRLIHLLGTTRSATTTAPTSNISIYLSTFHTWFVQDSFSFVVAPDAWPHVSSNTKPIIDDKSMVTLARLRRSTTVTDFLSPTRTSVPSNHSPSQYDDRRPGEHRQVDQRVSVVDDEVGSGALGEVVS